MAQSTHWRTCRAWLIYLTTLLLTRLSPSPEENFLRQTCYLVRMFAIYLYNFKISMLGKFFSWRHIEIFFLFSRKQDMTFLGHWFINLDPSLGSLADHKLTIFFFFFFFFSKKKKKKSHGISWNCLLRKCQILFSGKNKKSISNSSLLKSFTQHA